MRVSIIVPAYNASATLAACIQACLAQTHSDREVIIVDDGSTDATADIAAQYPVRCLRQQNKGPAAARNLGAAAATGEVLAFTDSDCMPAPDWIDRLLAGFTGEDLLAVGGTYSNANPQSRLSRLVHAEIRYRHSLLNGHVDFLGSFNFAVRRDAFETCCGFDESFRAASAEDNDLSYRLAELGRLRFAPDAVVAHHHPAELWPYLNTQRRHGMWRVKLYMKHRERAARGDQYAAMGDLVKPGLAFCILSLLFVATTPLLTAALSWQTGMAVYAAALITLLSYAWLSRRTNVAVIQRLSPINAFVTAFDSAYMIAVFFLRDIARQVGMIQGFWHFIIRGKRGGTREWLAHS